VDNTARVSPAAAWNRRNTVHFWEDCTMLRLAIVFLLVALIAGFFGFFGVAAVSMEAARIFFFVFIVLAVLAFLGGVLRTPPPV
jgi:uncharacterized membrane protein YtjA (UPF0391 family)